MCDSRWWQRLGTVATVCLTLLLNECLICPPVRAAGPAGAAQIDEVLLGVDGLMKPGSWSRIRVRVSGSTSSRVRVEAVTPDPAGNPVTYSSVPVDTSQTRQLRLFIKPGRLQTAITVRLIDDTSGAVLDSQRFIPAAAPGRDGTTSSSPPPDATSGPDGTGGFRVVKHSVPTALFCGGFSGTAARRTSARASDRRDGSSDELLDELRAGGAEVSRIHRDELPVDWRTLAVYRTIILTREFDLPARQSRAIEQWVSQGGHLVLAAGVGARTMAARTPGETVTAMLDLLDAGGLRSLRTQTLGSVLNLLEGSVAEAIRAAGAAELLDQPLDQLPEQLDRLKLEPAESRQLRNALRGAHRDLARLAQTRINASLKNGLLGAWALPSATLSATTLSDLTGLETLISSSWSIPVSGRHWGAVIADENARTLAAGLEGILLTQSSHGCGRVSVCGVALDQSPVSRWKEVRTFLQTLIDQPAVDTTETGERRRISRSGIEDLGTQLYAAVESLPQIRERNTLGVLGLTLLYLLLIGPADYYLVHRVLKKPQRTWATFPLAVALACLLGSLTAGTRNSSRIETRRLEILDLDQLTQFARTTTFSTVFSPQHARYEVEVLHAAISAQTIDRFEPASVSWFGFPEANYGGMYRSAGIEAGRPGYRVSPDSRTIRNLPIAIWSDRVVTSESLGQFAPGLIESDLRRTGTGQLHRESTLTHHLPFALRNWVLVHGNRVYYHDLRSGGLLDDTSIPPGQTWSPGDPTVTGREVRSFLTGAEFRFTARETNRTTSTDRGTYEKRQGKWNSRSDNLRDVVQMLTFHEVAGGRNYTGLSNTALRELELSEHLDLGRAILLAEADQHVSSLQISGREESAADRDTTTTIVRILLPVTEAPIARSLPKFDE